MKETLDEQSRLGLIHYRMELHIIFEKAFILPLPFYIIS